MGPGAFVHIVLVLCVTTIHNTDGQASPWERARSPVNREMHNLSVHRQSRKSPLRGDMDPTEFSTETDLGESDVHPLNQVAFWYGQPSVRGYIPQRPHPCEQSSCYPATGNLLIGREHRLKASSTCGLYKQERFCIVSHLEDRKKCFWCDSRDEHVNNPARSHRIENIVEKNFPGTEQRSWWQSENGVENVTIQLDLEAEFHFTHMIITFKTFRPAAMLIERSYDFGHTWQVYRYFASSCNESFPNVPKDKPRTLTDVVCESRYTGVHPSTNGEIIFRVLLPNLPIDDPYSPEVQNLLKMTNLRINFTKLHTLGDDLLDNREEIQEKYYYAIYSMVVRGSCSCYGHASRCLPLSGAETKPNMVHGRCECTHNTKGLNCEVCEDFYNDLPWKPALGKQTNACKRCNCNNHATSCHFDAAVYDASGRVSGGVCDNCQHHTMGRNCEQCQDFYYQDPNRDISDPDACQPCDCDPRGSLDEGICDSRTDVSNGLESGRCHCKANVDGRRCDHCKNGYWDFDEDNPEGCKSCTCNTKGTIDNQGCNVYTGECTCKRYVTGRDCNQCLLEYWGLSDEKDGCKPCDCGPGGSYDNHCDVITGQCRCRPHVVGRTCNQPEQTFFTASIDFYTYEAELARASETAQVVIREPFRDGKENSWTGTGFMRVFENTDLEFVVDNIQTGMDYDLVIRYEPQVSGNWDVVDVIIERPGPVDRTGPCANSIPSDDRKQISLPAGIRHVAVYPPVCLEAGKTYKIRLEFKRYSSPQETPSASILIDSIVLIPKVDSIPFFQPVSPANDLRRQEYERYRCGEVYYSVLRGNIPDVCKNFNHHIGFYIIDGAMSCQCDPTGSTSALCSDFGGTCDCKPNVVGRRCDRCAPGTYGFGPEGCRACDCNSIGALDNFCDAQTGQCRCRPNTYGRECDQCQPGYWNFPNCQRCDCNGHADICDSRTGTCINCRDGTVGHNCDRCIEGYYGDPRIGVDIPCRQCPCPGTIDSGHSYATKCSLDIYSQDVVCECALGFAGARCDVCADNYYGNPETPGGTCQSCNCSKNIDISRPGNCDSHSGECLQCLFNTEGFHCEVCKANYYGDAINQQCAECVCSPLGTNSSAGPCDRFTGQCPCLPNVIGPKCEQCEINHWKIASGTGCEPCNCDPIGSNAEQCNEYDGQCDCKEGFGGRLCNECQANFWGNPNLECKLCECDESGSATAQCHRNNGTCICLEGIGGDKCNQCARGYLGTAPYCSPCGECFSNWDAILKDLEGQTRQIIDDASKIKQTGATGAYTREFEKMEKKLEEITQLLSNTTISSQDLESLNKLVEELRANLNKSSEGLDTVEKLEQNTTQRILLASEALKDLRNRAARLNATALELKDNATHLQEANVEGALNLTLEAQKKSEKAQEIADESKIILSDSEKLCKGAEFYVNKTTSQFMKLQEENIESLGNLEDALENLEQQIPNLNEQVCDKHGDPCDSLCGGAGCGSCGGLSCEQGAVTKAERALKFALDAEKAIQDKEAEADDLLRGIYQAKQNTSHAHDLAQEAYHKAFEASNRSTDMTNRTQHIIKELNEFIQTPGASPSDIKRLAEQVLKKDIDLLPEQITELAESINNTISSLTNIEVILAETNDSLNLAQDLKHRADAAKTGAEGILERAQQVVDALDEAKDAQDKAEAAIHQANADIEVAERDLAQISSETGDAQQKANETGVDVEALQVRLKPLQSRFLQNAHEAEEVAQEAEKLGTEAEKANENAGKLRDEYELAAVSLSERAEQSRSAHARAQALQRKSSALLSSSLTKMKELSDMEKENNVNDKHLKDLSEDIDGLYRRMNEYLMVINAKSDSYRTCVS